MQSYFFYPMFPHECKAMANGDRQRATYSMPHQGVVLHLPEANTDGICNLLGYNLSRLWFRCTETVLNDNVTDM